jgi:hypothetical protein
LTFSIKKGSVQFNEGPHQGQTFEFDVSVQVGKNISVIISSNQRELLESFEVGMQLEDLQCFSPIGLFKGNGIVYAKNVIQDGPKRGDWVVDITVEAG